MISWTKIADDNWLVRWNGKTKKICSQEQVVLWTLVLMGEKEKNGDNHLDQIEYAMLEMIRNDHNYVEFGLFNTFVFSDRIGYETKSEIRYSH